MYPIGSSRQTVQLGKFWVKDLSRTLATQAAEERSNAGDTVFADILDAVSRQIDAKTNQVGDDWNMVQHSLLGIPNGIVSGAIEDVLGPETAITDPAKREAAENARKRVKELWEVRLDRQAKDKPIEGAGVGSGGI